MGRLELLIRINRQKLDERCAELGNIVRVRSEVDAAITGHQERLAEEYGAAAANPGGAPGFSAWATYMVGMGRELENRRSELRRIETAARDAVRECFADTHRLELAQAAAGRAARKLEDRKQELRADELELQRRMIRAGQT